MASRIIFHIDVNSAYLSWTSVENLRTGAGPDLREVPAIIGGDQKSRHGIVLAKSISAKKMGIYTSEPVASALKKCPNLLIFPPDHEMYRQYSHLFIDYLKTLTPDIEQVRVDECSLDFTGIAHRYGSPLEAADEIKNTIMSVLGLRSMWGSPATSFWRRWPQILRSRTGFTHFFPRRSRGKCGLFRCGSYTWPGVPPPRS